MVNKRHRLPKVVADFIENRGVSELDKLVNSAEKIERQKLNYQRLQTVELSKWGRIAELERLKEEQIGSIKKDVFESKRMDDIFKWGNETLDGMKIFVNPEFIMQKRRELQKLCGRDENGEFWF